jgi:hypothetical protein
MKKKIVFFLLILFVNISFLFSGPPDPIGPNSYCPHQYVRLNACMGVPVNCDEFTFIGAAVRPAYLKEQGFQRQSRPGYILLGTITGYTIYYALYPFHTKIQLLANQHLAGQFSPPELQKAILYGSVYAGFIILNIIILFISMLIFEKSIILISGNWKNKPWLLWMCLILLISNQVSKTFFWTAHQQMFTILTPLACLYTGLIIQKNKSGRRKILVLSLYGGLLFLVYGNFLLLLPSIVFSYFLNLKDQKTLLGMSSLITALMAGIIFFLPIALWIIYLKMTGVTFYSHEFSAFRQFVWIKDSLKISFSYFSTILYNNTTDFLKTSGSLFLSLLFLGAVLLCRLEPGKPAGIKIINQKNFAGNKILFFSFLSFIIFLWLIGYYADRLTFTLSPLLLFATVRFINAENLRIRTQWILASIIIALHLYTVLFNAPHLSEKLFFQ